MAATLLLAPGFQTSAIALRKWGKVVRIGEEGEKTMIYFSFFPTLGIIEPSNY